MAAGVTLREAIDAFGHEKVRGTYTGEVVAALRRLGVGCGDRLKRVSKARVLPKRCIVCIQRQKESGRRYLGHWMLYWDGVVYDPDGRYPEGFEKWRITSYLEITS